MPARMDAVSAALSGMNYAEDWTSVTAGNIANLDTPGYTDKQIAPPPSGDVTTGPPAVANGSGSPDLAVEIPNLMLSQTLLAANVATMNTATEMYKSILSLGNSN
jgi:flagellar hook protein FlgE